MKNTLDYYNGISSGYDELYLEEQLEKYGFIKSLIPRAKKVLDLGCGTGKITEKLDAGLVVGCDISFQMIKKSAISNKVVCCAEYLPFKDNSFDFILSLTVLQDIKNKEKAVNEIKRTAGRYIVSMLKRNKKKQDIKKVFNGKIKILEHEKDYFVIK